MQDKHYDNIKNLIERDIIEQTKHQIKSNFHKLMTYYKIGEELIEAEKDVENKYGAGIVKSFAKKLTKQYGTGYNTSNLKRMRQFYLAFPKVNTLYSQTRKGATAWHQLSWSHFKILLPIKDENKRNYYLNEAIKHCMGVHKLREYMKSNAYERLVDKEDIKLTYLEETNELKEPDITDMIKKPILISLNKSIDKLTEKILKELLIEELEKFMVEAGHGFAYMGSERPIRLDGKIHYVDLVFFNVELNCYVIFEIKLNELKKTDIGQIEFYVKYYDADVKKPFHNPTIGVTITKRVDPDIEKYNPKDNIKHTTYKLEG